MIILQVIFFALWFHSILRCLYFWQLKEYRLDRFKEFLASSEGFQYFFPNRYLLRPKLTAKIILLVLLTLVPAIFLAPLTYYLLIPFFTAAAVLLIMPFSAIGKEIVIFLANKKINDLRKNMTVIGITGSYGKTATKTILAHLLGAKYPVLSTSGTINTPIGVAQTILRQLRPSHKFFIVEMGAYRRGEIAQICRLVQPTVGILTGITKQHLGMFGSFEHLKQAKLELLESLPASGIAIVNADNPDSRSLGEKVRSKVTVKFYRRPKVAYPTNLIGDWQQLNIAGAVMTAKHFGIADSMIKSRLKSVPSFTTGLKQKIGINGAMVLDSSYNANPVGFAALIDYVAKLNYQRKILISSGIIELGQETADIHRQLGDEAKDVFDEIVITRKDLAEYFGGKTVYLPPTPKLLDWIKARTDTNTVVVLVSRMPQAIIKAICSNQS